MASVRELKKDIDYLIFEVISDCFVYSNVHPENKTDELTALISDINQLPKTSFQEWINCLKD